MAVRRQIARARTIDIHRHANHPSALHWPNVETLFHQWHSLCKRTITKMRICGQCGYARFGNCIDGKFSVKSIESGCLPPYAYCNMFVIPYICIDYSHYHICISCLKNKEREKLLSFMAPSYIHAIVKARPLYLQLLSLVDCRLGIVSKFNGFYTGFVRAESLLDSPLVAWNLDTLECSNTADIMKEVYDVFTANLLTNDLFKKYLCMLETPDPCLGVPIITADAVTSIVSKQRDKGIATNSMSINPFDPDLHILQDVSYNVPISRKRKNDLFHLGTVHCKKQLSSRDPFVTDVQGLSDDYNISIETMMFPFLFPQQRGHFQGDRNFAEYVRQRMQQLFSPFTLYKPYVLLIHQLKQSYQLVSATSVSILDKEYKTIREKKPNLSDEEVFRSLLKQNIDFKVPGSPAWHSKHLKDLKCMVERWGLPTFFLTLTSDEVSKSRWQEIDDLENLVKSINPSSTWKDCPVECVVLFHKRMQTFMKTFILCGSHGVLGDINQHVIRYELQCRGSLHAHIVLWCSEVDMDRVTKEICAYIPAKYNTEARQFIPPEGTVMSSLLYELVTTKQLHYCKVGICLQKDSVSGQQYCKLGFPKDVQCSMEPQVDPISGKWCYYRPGEEHRNVVPYHPVLLLLWGAHMNLQRVTNESWSFYLLKYALKCEPAGSLHISIDNAKTLGLPDLSDIQLKLVSAAVLSRTVSATEVALSSLQIPTIQRSSTVHFIDSSPPDRRTFLYRKASVVCSHPTRLYGMRPPELESLTFYDYFQNYELRKSNDTHSTVTVDLQGNFVFPTTRLVRFADYHPVYHSNQFFYNVLLNKVYFRNESELLVRNDKWWSYLHECIARGIVRSDKDIETLVIEYGQRHLYSTMYIAEMVRAINSQVPQAIWDEALSGQYTISIPSIVQKTTLRQHIQEVGPSFLDLTVDQRVVFESLKSSTNGLHLLTGSPGSGKSFFVKFMQHYWKEQGIQVILTATTGVAALRLSPFAVTVHSAFKIPRKGELRSLCRSSDAFDLLHEAKVIVIDECSMLTTSILTHIASRLHEVSQGLHRSKNPFDVNLVLLVGDMCQLPAICKHSIKDDTICMSCHVTSSPHFQQVRRHHLTTVLRQASDPTFLSFLNSIRSLLPTQHMINECLKECFISEVEAERFIDQTTTIICSHRDSVAKYNYMSLMAYFSVDHIIEVPIYSDAPNNADHAQWQACPKFHELTHVALGCRVLLTETIDLKKEAANGSFATVQDVIYDSNGVLCSIVVKIHSNGALLLIQRSVVKIRRLSGRESYSKSTFPLILAYAITTHKSQGATLHGKVLVVLKSAFSPGLTYVMLSQITNRKNLRIVGGLAPSDFNVFRDKM